MTNTSFGRTEKVKNLPQAYYYGNEEVKYYLENVVGTGGIISTTDDMLKWSNAITDNTLLSEKQKEPLFTPRSEYTDYKAYYGYGWLIDKNYFDASGTHRLAKKHKLYYHPGTDLGFYTMFLFQPDEDITIILLNNTGEFPRYPMTDLILNVLN